jgi:hypothetical protein
MWAAGLYEGEGSCNYAKSTENVQMQMMDPWPLDRLSRLFGGGRYQSEKVSSWGTGTVHRWAIYGARARGFLMTIYPMLSPRRQGQLRKAMRVQV